VNEEGDMTKAIAKRFPLVLGCAVMLMAAAASADEAPARAALPIAALAADLSPWTMFANADPVVKAVILTLALASLSTWTVWLAKTLELAAVKRRARAGLDALAGVRSLGAAMARLSDEAGPVAAMARSAVEEQNLSQGAEEGLLDRIRLCLDRIEAAERRAAQRSVGILATIGATAPFVGLFGTVWGIMNSFVGIARTQTTNLAVVAPGIAEALLATAAGLVAAIPAVVIYNHFTRSTATYRAILGDAAAELLRLASRDRDRRPAGLAKAAE
jgi:biopolymer transport protein ExbB